MAVGVGEIRRLRARAGEAGAFLRTLANRHRLMVLCSLIDGELSSGELSRNIGISPSNLSQHLGVLRRQRLVVARREGSTVYYRIRLTHVRPLLEALCTMFPSRRSAQQRGRRPREAQGD